MYKCKKPVRRKSRIESRTRGKPRLFRRNQKHIRPPRGHGKADGYQKKGQYPYQARRPV
jgi:hypothetical protein